MRPGRIIADFAPDLVHLFLGHKTRKPRPVARAVRPAASRFIGTFLPCAEHVRPLGGESHLHRHQPPVPQVRTMIPELCISRVMKQTFTRKDENGHHRLTRASELGQALSPANRLFRTIQAEPTTRATTFERGRRLPAVPAWDLLNRAFRPCYRGSLPASVTSHAGSTALARCAAFEV